MKKYKMLNFPQLGDERGKMVVVEGSQNIPFEIKRAFYSYNNSNDSVRGNHANRDSRFVIVALNGSCKIKVDDGKYVEELYLNNPEKGLFLDKLVWKEMYDFSEECILIIFSDCNYNSKEYINSYDKFKEIFFNRGK